jgi:hypothetical protein
VAQTLCLKVVLLMSGNIMKDEENSKEWKSLRPKLLPIKKMEVVIIRWVWVRN